MSLLFTGFLSSQDNERRPISLPAKVQDWMYGYDAPVVQVTDMYFNPSANLFEYLSFKHNVRPTVFTSILYNIDDEVFRTGRLTPSIYFQTDRWYIGGDVNDASNYPLIPDYFEEEWTSAGVAAFSGAVLGASKTARTPNHGSQMYAISGGVYGWDNDVDRNLGTNNNLELLQLIAYSKSKVSLYTNAQPNAMSFRNSQNGSKVMMMQKFISARGGGMDHSGRGYFTSFGGRSYESGDLIGNPKHDIDREYYDTGINTTRFRDEIIYYAPTLQEYIDECNGYYNTSLKVDKGLYTDFIHWHTCENDIARAYYEMIGDWDVEGGFRIWYGTREEVFGYMFYRDGVKEVNTYRQGSKIIVEVEKHDKYNTIPFPADSVNTSLSIEVDLSGTFLAGQNITSNNGKVLKIATDKYIVQVPYGEGMNSIEEVELYASSDDYLDLDKPDFTATTLGNGDVQINATKPVRLALFIENGLNYDCDFRSNTLSTTHTIPKAEIDKGVGHVGVITDSNQSILKAL